MLYNTTIVKDQALKSSRADANYTAKEYAKQIQTKVEKALDEAHHIADVFSTIKDQENPLVLNRDQANTLVKNHVDECRQHLRYLSDLGTLSI